MQVFLTGANGFVGSHILDALRAADLPVSVLLRPGCDRRFITSQLARVTVHEGSLSDPARLDRALGGATHVIHCAGATRALGEQEFFAVNEGGTRSVVEAVNRHGGIRRLVNLSSLAAVGSAARGKPLDERSPLRPGSAYGRSKLAGEERIRELCQTEYTILRPPGVYGPRDAEFLRFFQAVRRGFKPVFGDGGQELNFVYVADLAAATLRCLTAPGAAREAFFVAEPTTVTSRQFADLAAEILQCRARLVRIPNWALYALCLGQDVWSQITRRASVISRHKFAEYRAEALTCDATPLERQTGFVCATNLGRGLAQTLEWYRRERWL